jgi:hypothetical protein
MHMPVSSSPRGLCGRRSCPRGGCSRVLMCPVGTARLRALFARRRREKEERSLLWRSQNS